MIDAFEEGALVWFRMRKGQIVYFQWRFIPCTLAAFFSLWCITRNAKIEKKCQSSISLMFWAIRVSVSWKCGVSQCQSPWCSGWFKCLQSLGGFGSQSLHISGWFQNLHKSLGDSVVNDFVPLGDPSLKSSSSFSNSSVNLPSSCQFTWTLEWFNPHFVKTEQAII